MKVIFLDIDGVLNSISLSVSSKNGSTSPSGLSKEAFGLLKFIVDQTDAKIVICSTWRLYGSHEWFQGLFEAYGWRRPPVIDITRRSKLGDIRGDQINDWVYEHKPDTYICIDDDSDYYDDNNLVNVNGVYGLRLPEVLKAIKLLGGGKDEKTINDLQLHVDFKKE